MKNKIIEIETKYENGNKIKSIINNSEFSKKQNIEKEIENGNNTFTRNEFGETKIKENNKNLKLIIISSIIFLVLVIIITLIFMSSNNSKNKDDDLIDNNNERNKGVIQLINNGEFTIKKELLQSINSFFSCLSPPGQGKSTFGSNYYKILYRVKNDYFESSDDTKTHTIGIWMISDQERRKIPKYIYKDFLDVEGFQVDDPLSWKYVMIISFLSTELIILNKQERYHEIKKIIKIIEYTLKRMEKNNIPRILKVIYIQTIKKKPKPIEELLEEFEYDKQIFQMIKFKYIYLPLIPDIEGELINHPDYKKNFEDILFLLNKTASKYNAPASLINFVDMFNKALDGNTLFYSQKLFIDAKSEFDGIYSKYEKLKKRELTQKIPYLKKLEKNETFEDFIKKQINLSFEFEIDNSNYSFYGSSKAYNDFYDNLKKNKTFRIDPKDIFLDVYDNEKLLLENQENINKQKIDNEFLKKKIEIDNYFVKLKFYQKIELVIDLKLKINNKETEYKLKKENDLNNYFREKTKEKEKEWEDQIQRAKWKTPVQSYGNMTCENGHNLTEDVFCRDCQQNLYWVDSDEKYVICKGCNKVRKMSESLECSKCGAASNSKVKWIKGYKP